MRRRFFSALAVALVALSGAARVYSDIAQAQNLLVVVQAYNLNSTSFVYPIALGPLGPQGSTQLRANAVEAWYTNENPPAGATVDYRIKTASQDTATVVSFTASGGAFTPLSTGDMIQFNDQFGRPIYAAIFQKTDNNNVTLDHNVSITQAGGASYRWRKTEAGADDTYDGWFNVGGYGTTDIYADISQMTVTGGINMKVECKPAQAVKAATVLSSSNITAIGGFNLATVTTPYDVCRVGFAIGSSDDDSTTGKLEKISVYALRRTY